MATKGMETIIDLSCEKAPMCLAEAHPLRQEKTQYSPGKHDHVVNRDLLGFDDSHRRSARPRFSTIDWANIDAV